MNPIHGATLNGTVNPNGLDTLVSFEYGVTDSFGLTTPEINLPAGNVEVPVSADINTLDTNTVYFFRVVATNILGKATGLTLQFTTLNTDIPLVATLDASNIS